MHFKPINSFIIISCGNKTLYIMITKIEHRYKKEMTSYRYLCRNQECKLRDWEMDTMQTDHLAYWVHCVWVVLETGMPLQCTLCANPIEAIDQSACCVHYVLMFSNADTCALLYTTECYCLVFQSCHSVIIRHICNIAFS